MKNNKYFVLIIFIITYSIAVNSQQYALPKIYNFSDEILKSNKHGDQHTAFELSCIGEYKETLKIWDRTEEKKSELSQIHKKNFLKYHPIDAINYLSEKSKNEQIIISNEAHHQPYHRLFTTLLLQNFYNNGFRFFCVETINKSDTFLNQRKYPIINSGGYTNEPTYGNLVREALKIGFKLVAYEDENNSGFDSKGNNLREVEQAKNIKKILDTNPKAKILIHCGFGHIKETPMKSWGKAMAGRLNEYTGINPLTIDQVCFTEHNSPEFENEYFKTINLNYYALFVDSNGNTFSGDEENKQFDLCIYHPRTKFINGRPHWVFENKRKPYFIEKIETSFPCQVFAYLESEKMHDYNPFENPVPIDIIEIRDSSEKIALSLPNGKFNILIKDKKGKDQKFTISIE